MDLILYPGVLALGHLVAENRRSHPIRSRFGLIGVNALIALPISYNICEDRMKDMAEKRGFRWWASWYLRASYLLMWGFLMIAQGGEELLEHRFRRGSLPFRGPLSVATFVVLLWQLWAFWPRDTESEADKSPGIPLLGAICFGVLAWQREHAWAVLGISVELALLFAWAGPKVYRRSLVLAIIGWSIAGPAVFLFPWPNGERLDLVFVFGGFATALQGEFGLARDLSTLRGQSKDIVAA